MSQTPVGVNFLLTLTAAGHTVLQVTRFFLLSSNSNQLLCNWLHKVWPIFVFWQRQMDKTMCHQIFILGAWKHALDNDKKKSVATCHNWFAFLPLHSLLAWLLSNICTNPFIPHWASLPLIHYKLCHTTQLLFQDSSIL